MSLGGDSRFALFSHLGFKISLFPKCCTSLGMPHSIYIDEAFEKRSLSHRITHDHSLACFTTNGTLLLQHARDVLSLFRFF